MALFVHPPSASLQVQGHKIGSKETQLILVIIGMILITVVIIIKKRTRVVIVILAQ